MDAFLDYILPPLASSWSNFDQQEGLSSVGDSENGSQTTSTMLHECMHRNTNQNPFDRPGNMIFQESNIVHMNTGQNTSLFGSDSDDFKCHCHLCCFSDNQCEQEFLNYNMNLPTQPRNQIPDLRLSFPASGQGGTGSFCMASVGRDESNPLSTFPPQSLEDSQSTSSGPPRLWSSVYPGVHSVVMDQIDSQNYKFFPQHEHQISQSSERNPNQAYLNPNPPITQEQQLPMSADANIPNGSAKPRTRAKRGQATDPHSIAERLRREKIAERMKNLQALIPNSNKTDKASVLDEIIDYVKFLQLQVKVLNNSRFGIGSLSTNITPEENGSSLLTTSLYMGGGTDQSHLEEDDTLLFEQEVMKLMESNISTAMQYLQTKGLCLMPTALATAISIQKDTSAASIPPVEKNSNTSSQRNETKSC